MEKLTLSSLSKLSLKRFISITEQESNTYDWLKIDEVLLNDIEQQQLQYLKSRLLVEHTHLLNEATLWSRAIYPLLSLAEQGDIRAWAGVPLYVRYAHFEIEGIADGVLGKAVMGMMENPYIVVVETKRGIENQNPLFQLYGQLLAAARLNWESDRQERSLSEIFGCYTIADSWTFVRAKIDEIDSDKPNLRIEASREYLQQYEAETILKILKTMVAKSSCHQQAAMINTM